MSGTPRQVVFDCNIYFQALISPSGPAAQCLVAAMQKRVLLSASERTIAEFEEVAAHPVLRSKFHITDEPVAQMVSIIRRAAQIVDAVPETYTLEADPDDSHYINLAIAAGADLIVSRDRDLLRLMEPARPEAIEFQRLFPALHVLVPEQLLRLLATEGGEPAP